MYCSILTCSDDLGKWSYVVHIIHLFENNEYCNVEHIYSFVHLFIPESLFCNALFKKDVIVT
jgi:hypothetical protein